MKKKRILITAIIILALVASFFLGTMTEKSRRKFPIAVTETPERAQFEVTIDDTIKVTTNTDTIIRAGESIVAPNEDNSDQSSPDQHSFTFEKTQSFSAFNNFFEINFNFVSQPEAQKCPQPSEAGDNQPTAQLGRYVGSINSNKFHDPDCSWAVKIKDENKIWFQTAEEAFAAGYEPSNCATLD